MAAGRQWLVAVEHRDVVESEKPALKQVATAGVFAIDPPRERQQLFLQDTRQKIQITARVRTLQPLLLALDLEDTPGSPRLQRRIHIVEVPLVGRQFSVRVHVPRLPQTNQLTLGILSVDERERDRVKRRVP